MRTLKNMVTEVVALLVIAIALGFGVNSVRGKGSIRFSRNYFEVRSPILAPAPAAAQTANPGEAPKIGKVDNPGELNQPQARHEVANHSTIASSADPQPESQNHLDHPFNKIGFKEVAEVFYDPETRMGLNIFIDARNAREFAEGHIPGAYQCDHYCIEEYVEEIPAVVRGAERIIVYCAGGQCEDSILLCGDLIDVGIPYDNLCVFGGGWEAWKDNDMPIEKGEE
jgi:rhodanese-related sulfurtransferase